MFIYHAASPQGKYGGTAVLLRDFPRTVEVTLTGAHSVDHSAVAFRTDLGPDLVAVGRGQSVADLKKVTFPTVLVLGTMKRKREWSGRSYLSGYRRQAIGYRYWQWAKGN